MQVVLSFVISELASSRSDGMDPTRSANCAGLEGIVVSFEYDMVFSICLFNKSMRRQGMRVCGSLEGLRKEISADGEADLIKQLKEGFLSG